MRRESCSERIGRNFLTKERSKKQYAAMEKTIHTDKTIKAFRHKPYCLSDM